MMGDDVNVVKLVGRVSAVGEPRELPSGDLVVMVRVAERSILKSLTGSRVARSCRFSVLLVVAGVAIESLQSSQSLSLAFPI